MDEASQSGSGERERPVNVGKGHLPRLAAGHYRGHATVHWTLTVEKRATGWLSSDFHIRWRDILLHACARYDLLCPAYVLMPDHIHLVLMGLCQNGSDQKSAVAFLRKNLRAAIAPADWQKQAHDHVLRHHERKRHAFAKVAHYIAENPVRAKLTDSATDWEYTGSWVPGYPGLDPRTDGYWDLFWRIRAKLLR